MTDKQIKNGIDVSQCECYSIEYNSCSDTLSGSCIKEKCQTFRLLQIVKAKEQECEEWQAELADKASELQNIEEKIKPLMKRPDDLDCYDLEWIVCAFADEFNQLKAKNEELKKTIDDLLHKPEVQDKILWKIDNEALLGSKDAYIYKLEKTLTEIKEIAEKNLNIHTCAFKGCGYDLITNQILQKISECDIE